MATSEPRVIKVFANSEEVFLKRGIAVEPLVNGWPAWPHLIPPLQYALNLAYRHIPIMRSFVSNPSVHIAASMVGALDSGSFIDGGLEKVAAVNTLLEQTMQSCAELTAFASDYIELEKVVHAGAQGFSLEEFYKRVPTSLAGSIELVYDANSHPQVRVFDALLPHAFATHRLQQIYVGPLKDDKRKFFLSNPKLTEHEGFIHSLPFSDLRIDALAAARFEGVPFCEVESILESEAGNKSIDAGMFFSSTVQRRRRVKARISGDLSVRYFGHACVLVETQDLALLLDPLIAWETSDEDGRFSYEDLPPRIDYVAISHCHHDHLSVETLLQLRRCIGSVIVPRNNVGNVLDPSMSGILGHLGFSDPIALDPFDMVKIAGGRIVSLPFPGEHAELNIYSKHSLLIEVGGARLLFLADSNAIDAELYTKLSSQYGLIDCLFLGMECHGAPLSWLYGPLLSQKLSRKSDESRRLSASNADRAWEVVARLKPAKVFVYAMGQEPFVAHLTGLAYHEDSVQLREARKLVDRCKRQGIDALQLCGSQDLAI